MQSQAGITQLAEYSSVVEKVLIPPMPASSYVEELGLAAMLVTKKSAGVTPEVNLREHVTYMPLERTNNAAHYGFETQRRCHQKSKTGLSVTSQKLLMPSKIFFSKK